MWKLLLQVVTLIGVLLATTVANADDALEQNGNYIGPSVEDNVAAMDTDKNGFADVFEVRAFLEQKHGNDYQKDLLDKWESSARGKSCSTPFAKDLYVE